MEPFKAWKQSCTSPPVISSGVFPAEYYWLVGKQDDRSRRVESNRIQLDARNAGPNSPVFLFFEFAGA